jgi:hypothetical protein
LGNKPSRIILLIQKNIHFDAKFGQPGWWKWDMNSGITYYE